MLLNPANATYNVGDKVLFLGIRANDAAEARPFCGLNNGYNRDALRRMSSIVLVEGIVTAVENNSQNTLSAVYVTYWGFVEGNPQNREYGRFNAMFGLSQQRVASAIGNLQTYRSTCGQPSFPTEDQMDFAEQFMWPVPVSSAGYRRLLEDIKTCVGRSTENTVMQDVAAVRAGAESHGIELITYPDSGITSRCGVRDRDAVQSLIDAHDAWKAAVPAPRSR